MNLKESRKAAINNCVENNQGYTYISYDKTNEFYLTNEQEKHTVYFVNKSGSMHAYAVTDYAKNFHIESVKKENSRRNDDKRKLAEMCNRVDEEEV